MNLIVPPNVINNKEIVHVLAKSAIQRGRDIGFPLLRFDVTNEDMSVIQFLYVVFVRGPLLEATNRQLN